jgi:hypothetical protein
MLIWNSNFFNQMDAKFKAAQKFVDSEVLRLSTPYVPMDTGELIRSGIRETVIGSGVVAYKTPYSKKLYYATGFNFRGAPKRGAQWFEKMKAKHKEYIVRKACEMLR